MRLVEAYGKEEGLVSVPRLLQESHGEICDVCVLQFAKRRFIHGLDG
jgi:hypothetical protein